MVISLLAFIILLIMISALYVHKDSIYRKMGLDCWDLDRNAQLWPGGNPCIAHPPCRQWGKLMGLANVDEAEKALAVLAVSPVRANGGVLEHPKASKLWQVCNLPHPGEPLDEWGGFTLLVWHNWFGGPIIKPTYLYIVGVDKKDIPLMPFSLDAPTRKFGNLTKKQREQTPKKMAAYLVDVCNRITKVGVSCLLSASYACWLSAGCLGLYGFTSPFNFSA